MLKRIQRIRAEQDAIERRRRAHEAIGAMIAGAILLGGGVLALRCAVWLAGKIFEACR